MKTESRLEKILERLGGESRIHYSLDHFTEALSVAGHPERSVQTVVISGTNGKGSVSLFISSALKSAGYRTGTYLSPHLQHFRERFLLDGRPIAADRLDALAEQWEPLADRFQLTYFEFLTLLCFLWAKEERLERLVLEVGMGGRLDATNVTEPLATVITNIDYDHQAYLGDTLEKILAEKRGITRPGVPLFTGITQPALLDTLKGVSRLSILKGIGSAREVDWSGQTVDIDGHAFRLKSPASRMGENAALAYEVVRYLCPELPLEKIHSAFGAVVNPGRLEVVQENPRVVLSGDHNPAGVQTLVETLRRLNTRPRILCAFSPDKPHAQMVAMLREVSSEIVLTLVPRFAGKMPPEYYSLAPFDPHAQNALERMLIETPLDETLLVTGSLYLVGELRGQWFPA